MKDLFKNGSFYILLLACFMVAFIAPTKARKRVVITAKTPIVLPASKTNVYSRKIYRKYARLINAASEEFDVPAPLIAAVIKAESNFRPYITSNAGAMGLMQMTAGTWVLVGGVGSPYNPGQNIRMGTKYLASLIDEFDGNLILALAAYNAGPGAVKKFRQVPPYSETRRYVPKVLSYYRNFRRLLNVS